MLVLALFLACSGDDAETPAPTDGPEPVDSSAPTVDSASLPTGDTGTESTPTATTGTTGSTGATGDTGSTLGTIDCAALVGTPLSSGPVPGARAYHGIVITDAGTLIGTDGSNLIEADGYGASSVYLPGTGRMEQLDTFADGTIVGANTSGDIVQIFPTGGVSVLATVPSTYGVKVGPDDKVYVADWSRIMRIDPVAGTVETWLDGGFSFSPKAIEFNIDFTKMYAASISQGGDVYEIDLDANYDPVGAPRVFASTPGSWHDGIAMDICGNLYVPEYNNRAMYKISPGGNVTTFFQPADTSNYGHGVVFGNGVGAFSETAIYTPLPYNGDTVAEVEIGVPYRTYTGPVINQP